MSNTKTQMDLTQTDHSFYKTSTGGNTRMVFSQEGRNRNGKLDGGLRSSTRGTTENIFCESIVE